jgi:hypothetical protein
MGTGSGGGGFVIDSATIALVALALIALALAAWFVFRNH